jgi:hypothetical protein
MLIFWMNCKNQMLVLSVLWLCHRGVGKVTKKTVGFSEWTAQFSVWKTTGKDSSEACNSACQNCAIYSVCPSGVTSHIKTAQFNWWCTRIESLRISAEWGWGWLHKDTHLTQRWRGGGCIVSFLFRVPSIRKPSTRGVSCSPCRHGTCFSIEGEEMHRVHAGILSLLSLPCLIS